MDVRQGVMAVERRKTRKAKHDLRTFCTWRIEETTPMGYLQELATDISLVDS